MSANAEQAEYWNSVEAAQWVDDADQYDAMLERFVTPLLDAARLSPEAHVLDVGCGTGTTTLAAARVVEHGRAQGIDLSAAMLASAREKAARAGVTNVAFEQMDAQDGALDSASFDALISRFGVMFFADPVAAFTNLRRSVRPGGRVAFFCWQGLLANEWMFVPGMAVAAHAPLPEPADPHAPGPFAFGEADRTREILLAAGLTDVEITASEGSVLVGGHGSLDDAVAFLRRTGMSRTLLADATPDQSEQAFDAIREALRPYETDEGVRLGSAAWLVTARA